MERDALYSSSLSFYRAGTSNTNDKNNVENDKSKIHKEPRKQQAQPSLMKSLGFPSIGGWADITRSTDCRAGTKLLQRID
jgi:hypothetical protein